jgi:hypothetical protein
MARTGRKTEKTMKKRGCRIIAWLAGGAFLLCIVAAGISGLTNLALPKGPARLDRLDELDKARLAEALHLKETLGEAIWPGLGQAAIPILLWNREYAFLTGYPQAPAGWKKVPDDTFAGRPYYRQPTQDPENFAVLLDGRWVASMATKHETDLFFREQFQQGLPPVVKQVFPYRLLIFPSETQITAVLHELFHAYQATVAPEHFAAADQVYNQDERYWELDATMHASWTAEIELLVAAAQSESAEEAADLAQQFLDLRAQRRAGMDPALVNYERQLEWLEGLAKYVEMESWRQAAENADYTPVAEVAADPDFDHYRNFEQHSRQELNQMRLQAARAGDVRFYYTGMAQGFLLDQLLPGWKARALGEGVYLEDLVQEGVEHSGK